MAGSGSAARTAAAAAARERREAGVLGGDHGVLIRTGGREDWETGRKRKFTRWALPPSPSPPVTQTPSHPRSREALGLRQENLLDSDGLIWTVVGGARCGRDLVGDVQPRDDLAEGGVLVVEKIRVLYDDEELRGRRVGVRRAGHREDAPLVGDVV